MKRTALIITALFIALISFGCSNNGQTPADNAAEGSWKLYSVVINDSEYIGEAADESLKGASECVLTVDKDGNFDFTIDGADVVGTYEIKDGAITFYEDNAEFPVAVEEGKLIMDLTAYSGVDMRYVFVRE